MDDDISEFCRIKRKRKRKEENNKNQKLSEFELAHNLMLSRLITLISIDEPINKKTWLTDINIDLALNSLQADFPNILILTCAQHALLLDSNFNWLKFICDLKTEKLIMVLCYQSHWIVATNIDTGRSNLPISSVSSFPVFVYDSFGDRAYLNGLKLTLSHMFPSKHNFLVHHAKTNYKQVSSNDCGLFALAYVRALCLHLEPSLIEFCQKTMRHEYNSFIMRDCKEFRINVIKDNSLTDRSVMNPCIITIDN